jgi:ATPase subunit of ABC transporter with duplicated ATPase domains
LENFPGTIYIATHDRTFTDQFATGIWSPHDGAFKRFLDRAEMNRR